MEFSFTAVQSKNDTTTLENRQFHNELYIHLLRDRVVQLKAIYSRKIKISFHGHSYT